MSSLQTTTKARSPTGSPALRPALPDTGLAAPPSCPSPSHSSANKCLLKVAGYAAQLEQYQKAIDIYEQVGVGPSPSSCLLLHPHSQMCPSPPAHLAFSTQPVLSSPLPEVFKGLRAGQPCRTHGEMRLGVVERGPLVLSGRQGVSHEPPSPGWEGEWVLPLMFSHLPPLCPLCASFP